jgi:hypothetical protein
LYRSCSTTLICATRGTPDRGDEFGPIDEPVANALHVNDPLVPPAPKQRISRCSPRALQLVPGQRVDPGRSWQFGFGHGLFRFLQEALDLGERQATAVAVSRGDLLRG